MTPNPSKVDAVRHQLKDELAGQDVDLFFENNVAVLRGTVKDLTQRRAGASVAMTLGRPVNLLHVTTPPPQTQVLLKVRFCDVDRQFSGEYGVNFFRNGRRRNRRRGFHQPVHPDRFNPRCQWRSPNPRLVQL